ncbi:MAG: DUF1838 family protein [Rhodospirillaceae bacterium]
MTNYNESLNKLTRRTAIAGATAALSYGKPKSLSASKVSGLDRNKVYVQLRGNMNRTDGLWAYTGSYWGKPQGEIARQLFRVDGFSFNNMTLREDGGVEQKMIECGFWQDPETGKLADQWINPMNGLKCEPKHFKSSQVLSFDSNGQQEIPQERKVTMRHIEGTIVEPIVDGPVIWSQERLIIKSIRPKPGPGIDPLTHTGPIMTATSLATYTAQVDKLTNDFVPTTMHYQSMGGWYAWMRMGQRAGTCSFELVGRKLQAISEVPKRVMGFLTELQPGFLEDPWSGLELRTTASPLSSVH